MIVIHYIFSMNMQKIHFLKKPIVPTIMLNGIVTSAISKHLPGPGSHIPEQNFIYLEPVYHYETIEFLLEVQHINYENNIVRYSSRWNE